MNKALVLLVISLMTMGYVMAQQGIQDMNPGFLADNGGSGSEDDDNGQKNESLNYTESNEENQTKVKDTLMKANQNRTREGYQNFTNREGKEVQVKLNNGASIMSNGVEARTKLPLRVENDTERNQSLMKANLSNGRNAEVKIMPSTASERALSVLAAKKGNFTIELKEVGKGNETKLAYEVETETEGKFLGLFKTRTKVKTQVSAETGEILRIKKPFLTSVKTTETAE